MAKTRVSSGQINPSLKFDGTGSIALPVGTTAQRPGTPRLGDIRYNSDLGVFEGYTGSAWGSVGPFPGTFVEYFTGDGSTYEFVTSQAVGDVDYLIVTINGIQLTYNIDYRVEGSNIITFTEADSSQNPPLDGSEITVRGFVAVTSASVAANSIGVAELALSEGTSGQVLTTNGAGTISFQTIPTQDPVVGGDLSGTASSAQINENTVSVRELKVSDGQPGQVLATDGSGNLSFITVSGGSGGIAASSFFDLTGTILLNQIQDDFILNEKIATFQITPNRLAYSDSTIGTDGQVLSIDANGDFVWIDVSASAGGEANTATNVGAGVGVYKQKTGVNLEFKTLTAGSGITLTPGADEIQIGNSRVGFTNIAVSGQSTIVADTQADTLTFAAGAGIGLTTDAGTDTITITSTATAPDQFKTFTADSGSTTANSATDSLAIVGGAGISTSIVGDALTVTNSSPNVDQNIWATVTADSGSTSANSTNDSLAVVGGAGISTSIVGDTLTITNTGGVVPNNFGTISVSGQSDVVADTSSDTLTIVAGSNITITTDAGTDTITINASAGSGGTGTVTSGTANRLAYYATTGDTVVETNSGLTWNGTSSTLTVTNLDVTGTVGNITTGTISSGSITTSGDIDASSGTVTANVVDAQILQSSSAGVPTFTSGSDIVFDAAGEINVSDSKIVNVADPTNLKDAVNKQYVDSNAFKHFNIGADDSTMLQVNSGESIKIIGGSNISTTSDAEGNITIIGASQLQQLFRTISVSGQSDIVADSTTDTLTVAAGTGISITTDAGTDTLTISSTVSGGASNLSGLSDVDTTGVTQGDVLYYNGSAGQWEPHSGPVIRWQIGSNGVADYTFDGPGFPTTANDPDLYLYRGHTYIFDVSNMAGAHPFYIKTTPGIGIANQYTDGVTGNGDPNTVTFEVPMNAPSTLYYQCSVHAAMVGTINVV